MTVLMIVLMTLAAAAFAAASVWGWRTYKRIIRGFKAVERWLGGGS